MHYRDLPSSVDCCLLPIRISLRTFLLRLADVSRNSEIGAKERRRLFLRTGYSFFGISRFAEKAVLGHFILLALLWLFRDPRFMKGWAIIFEEG